MKNKIRLAILAAVAAAVLMGPAAASADNVKLGLAFLFPIPVPVPIYKIQHEPSTVTLGLLFPIPLPVPVYDYGDHETGGGQAEPVRYGRLQTMVRPENASVFVDGEFMGRAGDFFFRKDALTVQPGTHTVELRADGFVSYTADVEVRPGGIVEISRDLRPLK